MAAEASLPPGRVLIVGLGNPGPAYEATRHNIGFRAVELLARRHGISLTDRRFKALGGTGTVASRPAMLLLPQTFMNLSGESVQPAAAFHKLAVESILVLHDDIDLPLGQIRLKQGGGHAGHNGLRSMDQHLGSRNYHRIRLGVGRPTHPGVEVAQWVLASFAASERPQVETLCERGADAVEWILADGLTAAQNRLHPTENRLGGRDTRLATC